MIRHVCIGVATLERPEGLLQLVRSLSSLALPAGLALRVVVIDNSACHSALAQKATLVEACRWPLELLHEPRAGLSHARNAALAWALAQGCDALAFVDDDETVEPRWLAELWRTGHACQADAVIGRVALAGSNSPPRWTRTAFALDDRQVANGQQISFGYTGNSLIMLATVRRAGLRFDARLGTSGGEDVLFFRRLHTEGARIVFAAHAVTHELYGSDRQRWQWWLRRWFRSANSTAYIDLLGGRKDRKALVMAGTARLVAGLAGSLLLAPGLPAACILPLRCLRLACRGAGQLGAAAGFRYQEYSSGNRRVADSVVPGLQKEAGP